MYHIDVDAFFHPTHLSTRLAAGGDDAVQSVRYLVPFCRTDSYRWSFVPVSIRLWNQLPAHITMAQTLDAFRAGLVSLH